MTFEDLGRRYFSRARVRREALNTYVVHEAWADVVRECQELVELVLKGMLRIAGIEPPHHHDVGPFIREFADRLKLNPETVERAAGISQRLRKERELAFYGDVDMIPSEVYKQADAERALVETDWILTLIEKA